MAESRVEKIGSIFSRITGLLKSGSMKPNDRPIWYDVYAAFPPKFDPHFDRPPVDAVQREIIYAEDFIRARFFKEFKNPGVFNLFSSRGMPASER
ncbi:putative 28S ribosomal protein S23, mitochondrial [Trichinella pseudospiralis]|nr:putative 28S ribosomal protein S23, mitochondrial [Trichinella pseudospiralis]